MTWPMRETMGVVRQRFSSQNGLALCLNWLVLQSNSQFLLLCVICLSRIACLVHVPTLLSLQTACKKQLGGFVFHTFLLISAYHSTDLAGSVVVPICCCHWKLSHSIGGTAGRGRRMVKLCSLFSHTRPFLCQLMFCSGMPN